MIFFILACEPKVERVYFKEPRVFVYTNEVRLQRPTVIDTKGNEILSFSESADIQNGTMLPGYASFKLDPLGPDEYHKTAKVTIWVMSMYESSYTVHFRLPDNLQFSGIQPNELVAVGKERELDVQFRFREDLLPEDKFPYRCVLNSQTDAKPVISLSEDCKIKTLSPGQAEIKILPKGAEQWNKPIENSTLIFTVVQ